MNSQNSKNTQLRIAIFVSLVLLVPTFINFFKSMALLITETVAKTNDLDALNQQVISPMLLSVRLFYVLLVVVVACFVLSIRETLGSVNKKSSVIRDFFIGAVLLMMILSIKTAYAFTLFCKAVSQIDNNDLTKDYWGKLKLDVDALDSEYADKLKAMGGIEANSMILFMLALIAGLIIFLALAGTSIHSLVKQKKSNT